LTNQDRAIAESANPLPNILAVLTNLTGQFSSVGKRAGIPCLFRREHFGRSLGSLWHTSLYFFCSLSGWNFGAGNGVWKGMQREWTLRQILAIVRGIGVMVGLFWLLVAVQFVPAMWHGGFVGVREQMVRIAVTGVAQDHWEIAVMRMDQALAFMGALACGLFLLQRYLGRKVSTNRAGR
jgi:hypothetical protein